MNEGDTRTRLRDVALDLFGRQGVQSTSTRTILEAAGLKNPSAISYHFGSKAELVDDLVAELIADAWPLVQLQVDLVRNGTPSVVEWASVATNSAIDLISTERGCLLSRVWWEYDCILHPDAFEEFLGSGLPLATEWLDAIVVTFPDIPRVVAVGRNLVLVRTLAWMIARRARRLLIGMPVPAMQVTDHESLRRLLLETSLALLTAPTELTEADLRFE